MEKFKITREYHPDLIGNFKVTNNVFRVRESGRDWGWKAKTYLMIGIVLSMLVIRAIIIEYRVDAIERNACRGHYIDNECD